MRSAVFLERDGLLNKVGIERDQPKVPISFNEFVINEEARKPLEALKAAGFLLLVVTNQPGISKGTLSRRELDLMHNRLRFAFPLDDILVCHHDEMDRCPCRKPKPGLFTEAAFKWQIDLDRSFMISDKWQDALAAHVAGCTSLVIRSPWMGSGHRDFLVADLDSAANKILTLQHSSQLVGAGSA